MLFIMLWSSIESGHLNFQLLLLYEHETALNFCRTPSVRVSMFVFHNLLWHDWLDGRTTTTSGTRPIPRDYFILCFTPTFWSFTSPLIFLFFLPFRHHPTHSTSASFFPFLWLNLLVKASLLFKHCLIGVLVRWILWKLQLPPCFFCLQS